MLFFFLKKLEICIFLIIFEKSEFRFQIQEENTNTKKKLKMYSQKRDIETCASQYLCHPNGRIINIPSSSMKAFFINRRNVKR